MPNYDFSTLNPTDFERFVCDLLNASAGQNSNAKYRTSKEGKDKGIDILFSTPSNDFEIVVQVKHYLKSTYSKLKSDLVKTEAAKVKALNPGEYVFVTSLPLSVENKKEIMQIFSPYIKSLEDILGKDDLNNLLALHPRVEEQNYKLWFSGTMALQKLLNYKFVGRNNEFSEDVIRKKLRLFVNTPELTKAKSILEYNKFLIITGEPGVGKTTLSEMLIYRYLSLDFELTCIIDDIKDIEFTLRDDDSKQIFYFDDFLGHTQAEIQKSKSAEASLLKIISLIEKGKNKYLILNTRKFILSTFLEESERLRNFNPLRGESKIEIGSYTYGAKRRMLDNHIFESELSAEHIRVLQDYSFLICTHANFSPRHIDFYTNQTHSGSLTPVEFKAFIKDNLDNPKEIWRHAYCKQIGIYENLLLNTLYSLGGSSYIDKLEAAYNARLNYETVTGNLPKPLDSFRVCLSNLNGGFIEVNSYGVMNRIDFVNPSLEDFLHHWIGENSLELERILFSAINLNQWYYFFKPLSDSPYIANDRISVFFIDNYHFLLSDQAIDLELYKAAMLVLHFDEDENTASIVTILKKIKSWNFMLTEHEIIYYSLRFLDKAKSKPEINKTISCFKLEFFVNTILTATHIAELIEIVSLFDSHYGFNFRRTFQNREDDFKFIPKVKKIKRLCKELVQDMINLQHGYLLDNRAVDAHLDIIEQIKYFIDFIGEYLFPNFKVNYKILTQKDWNSLIEMNIADELVLGQSKKDYDYPEGLGYEDYDEYEEYYDYERERYEASSFEPVLDFEEEDDHDDLPF